MELRAWVAAFALAMTLPSAAAALEIEARLLRATPAPEPARVAPYPRALCTFLYSVRKVHAGTYEGDRILVVKWAVWNKAKVRGLPAEAGAVERLRLVPWIDHPEFARERIVDDVGEKELVVYYDESSMPGNGGAATAEGEPPATAEVVRGTAAGWLFLAEELRHTATGRFGERDWRQVSRAGVDPLPAMLDFQRRVAALDVKLLVVPVPAKGGDQSLRPRPGRPGGTAGPVPSSVAGRRARRAGFGARFRGTPQGSGAPAAVPGRRHALVAGRLPGGGRGDFPADAARHSAGARQ